MDKTLLLQLRRILIEDLKNYNENLKDMSLEELEQYYLELRKREFKDGVALGEFEIRETIHPILLKLITIDRLLSFEGLEVISDESIKTDKPIIYACTHIGGNDIARTFEAMKEHAYLFLGDPKGIYQDVTGLLLHLNGVVCMETSDKEDRGIAKERGVEVLKNGSNLLIYPEGAWNTTHNLPVMDLYDGATIMALESGAEIVPIAIEQFGKKFYVKIGKNIDIISAENINEMSKERLKPIIREKTEIIRQALGTLKMDIWEYYWDQNKRKLTKRAEITQEEINNYEQSIVDKCGYGFSVEDVHATRYNDRKKQGYEFTERLKQQLNNTINTVAFDEEKDKECKERAKVLVKELRQKYGRE